VVLAPELEAGQDPARAAAAEQAVVLAQARVVGREAVLAQARVVGREAVLAQERVVAAGQEQARAAVAEQEVEQVREAVQVQELHRAPGTRQVQVNLRELENHLGRAILRAQAILREPAQAVRDQVLAEAQVPASQHENVKQIQTVI